MRTQLKQVTVLAFIAQDRQNGTAVEHRVQLPLRTYDPMLHWVQLVAAPEHYTQLELHCLHFCDDR